MATAQHDWLCLSRSIPRNVYETMHRSYVCRKCGKRAGSHYKSHRHGWQQTKNWDSPCITEHPTLF